MKTLIILLGLVFSLALFSAQDSSLSETVELTTPLPSIERTDNNFELGIAGGYPTLLGITLGYWGLPAVFRVTIGAGAQIDIGYRLFKQSGGIKRAFAGISAGLVGPLGIFTYNVYTVGPSVGLSFGDFLLQAGPCFTHVTATNYSNSRSYLGVQGQVSYTVVF
jgi:hypothetical protein